MYWIRVRADKPAPAKATPAPPPAEEPDAGLVHLESVEPEFPTTIVRRIRKGNVEVRLEVEPGGTVVGATVVETSHPGLNRSAVEALKQWRFKPSTRTHVALVNLVFDIDR
jgi:TonB family protein